MMNINQLSDQQILDAFSKQSHTEWQATLTILNLIKEAEQRQLFIRMGYRSTFSYLVDYLKYSEGQANRRIWSARCMAIYPIVTSMLIKRTLNLSTINVVHRLLTRDNHKEILGKIAGRSLREVQEIACGYGHEKQVKDRLTPIGKRIIEAPASSPNSPDLSKSNSDLFNGRHENQDSGSGLPTENASSKNGTSQGNRSKERSQTVYKIQFEINEATKAKLTEVQSLLSSKYPKGVSYEQLLTACLDGYIEKHSSAARDRRRKERQARTEVKEKQQQQRSEEVKAKQAEVTPPPQQKPVVTPPIKSRYIPVALRDSVWRRDQGKCTFIEPGGCRCESKWDLEIEHLVPFALGGTHDISNLTLRCRAHNMTTAYHRFGANKINAMIKRQ